MPELDLIPVPCDFCGHLESEPVFVGRDRLCGLPGEFPVVRCSFCGLNRTDPQPSPESLGGAYPEGYEIHAAGLALPTAPAGALRRALVNVLGYPLGERDPALLRPEFLRGL